MPENSKSGEVAKLSYPGGEIDLEIVQATEGSDGIALGSLLAKTGYPTYDGGFVNTASTIVCDRMCASFELFRRSWSPWKEPEQEPEHEPERASERDANPPQAR